MAGAAAIMSTITAEAGTAVSGIRRSERRRRGKSRGSSIDDASSGSNTGDTTLQRKEELRPPSPLLSEIISSTNDYQKEEAKVEIMKEGISEGVSSSTIKTLATPANDAIEDIDGGTEEIGGLRLQERKLKMNPRGKRFTG